MKTANPDQYCRSLFNRQAAAIGARWKCSLAATLAERLREIAQWDRQSGWLRACAAVGSYVWQTAGAPVSVGPGVFPPGGRIADKARPRPRPTRYGQAGPFPECSGSGSRISSVSRKGGGYFFG